MLLYSNYENSYESWIPNNKKIYRIDQQLDATKPLTENTPSIFANTIDNEIPEVKFATALQKFDFDMPFYSGMNNSFNFKNFYGVDSSFLQIFPFKLKYGSFKDFYTTQQIIISEKVSNAFFGDENPVGKTISMGFNTDLDFKIVGVLSESGPTHLRIEAISYYTLSSIPNNWGTISSMPFTTYVELNETADASASVGKIKNLYQKNIDRDKESLVVILEPINKIHLSSLITGNSNLKFFLAIIFLSGLLLIISCLNFINLIIAKSSIRNKEFAIKKLLGTTRPSLIKQFLSETFLQTIISFVLALGLLYLLMPYLEKIVGLNENLLASISKPIIITQLIGLILFITIITSPWHLSTNRLITCRIKNLDLIPIKFFLLRVFLPIKLRLLLIQIK